MGKIWQNGIRRRISTSRPRRNCTSWKRIRREKLAELQAAGKDPFQQVRFERDHYTTDIHEHFDELEGKTVRLAGRMMSKRIMGKASFLGYARPLRPICSFTSSATT